MKTITVLSGKGGVGKSSIAASLAVHLSKKKDIIVADCDVDASNLGLVLGVEEYETEKEISTNEIAFTNENARNCKEIVDNCAFSAISWNKSEEKPEINRYLCEGCGACKLLCPKGIEMKKVKNAKISQANTDYNFPIVSGQLKMGESGSGKVVDEVKKVAGEKDKEMMLVDSAAGIGCPVIASVQNSDYIVAVTEPTPSALSDLKRGLEIVEHFGIPYGLIINKFDLNKKFSKKIEKFALEKNTKVLGKVPYSKKFVESLTELKPVCKYDKNLNKQFEKLLNEVLEDMKNKKDKIQEENIQKNSNKTKTNNKK